MARVVGCLVSSPYLYCTGYKICMTALSGEELHSFLYGVRYLGRIYSTCPTAGGFCLPITRVVSTNKEVVKLV